MPYSIKLNPFESVLYLLLDHIFAPSSKRLDKNRW